MSVSRYYYYSCLYQWKTLWLGHIDKGCQLWYETITLQHKHFYKIANHKMLLISQSTQPISTSKNNFTLKLLTLDFLIPNFEVFSVVLMAASMLYFALNARITSFPRHWDATVTSCEASTSSSIVTFFDFPCTNKSKSYKNTNIRKSWACNNTVDKICFLATI